MIPSRGAHVLDVPAGETYSWFVTGLVPRVFAEDKVDPTSYLNEFGRSYGFLYSSNRTTSISVPPPAEAYLNFGFAGLLLVMPLMGAFYRVVAEYFRDRRADPAILAVYAVLAWPFIVGHENIVALSVGGFVKLAAVIMLALLLVGAIRPTKPADPSPSHAAVPRTGT